MSAHGATIRQQLTRLVLAALTSLPSSGWSSIEYWGLNDCYKISLLLAGSIKATRAQGAALQSIDTWQDE